MKTQRVRKHHKKRMRKKVPIRGGQYSRQNTLAKPKRNWLEIFRKSIWFSICVTSAVMAILFGITIKVERLDLFTSIIAGAVISLLTFVAAVSYLRARSKDFALGVWVLNFLLGLLTTYLGFTFSTATGESLKAHEDKSNLASLLALYAFEYDQYYNTINSILTQYQDSMSDPEHRNPHIMNKTLQSDEEKLMNDDVKEGFLPFLDQNASYYTKLSPSLQKDILQWRKRTYYMERTIEDGMQEDIGTEKKNDYFRQLLYYQIQIRERYYILNLEKAYVQGVLKEREYDVSMDLIDQANKEARDYIRENQNTKSFTEIEEDLFQRLSHDLLFQIHKEAHYLIVDDYNIINDDYK